MQRLIYIIFVSFFFMVSCAKQKPKGILSDRRITELLTEVSLIDAYLNTLPIDSGTKVMPVLYDNLFKEFDIDSIQFKQNLDFYYGNPILTEKIYTDVQKQLSSYEKDFRIQDSIRSAYVNDSVRRITRLQNIEFERRNLLLHYHRDTTKYTYQNLGQAFFRRPALELNAYGIQSAIVPSDEGNALKTSIEFLEPMIKDSILSQFLSVPIQKLLLNVPKDSSSSPFNFKLMGVYFLHNSGLPVKTGFTTSIAHVLPSEITAVPVQTGEEILVDEQDPTSPGIVVPEVENRIPLEVVREQIVPKEQTPKNLNKQLTKPVINE